MGPVGAAVEVLSTAKRGLCGNFDQQMVGEETLASNSSGLRLGPLTTSGLCRKDEVMASIGSIGDLLYLPVEGPAGCPHCLGSGYLLGPTCRLRHWRHAFLLVFFP